MNSEVFALPHSALFLSPSRSIHEEENVTPEKISSLTKLARAIDVFLLPGKITFYSHRFFRRYTFFFVDYSNHHNSSL